MTNIIRNGETFIPRELSTEEKIKIELEATIDTSELVALFIGLVFPTSMAITCFVIGICWIFDVNIRSVFLGKFLFGTCIVSIIVSFILWMIYLYKDCVKDAIKRVRNK